MNDKSNGNSLLKTRIAWLLLILTSFGLLPSRVVAGGTRSEPVDLGVGISAVTSCLDAGQIMTFAWSLTNAGPSNVTSSISVTNFLSSGLVYVSSSVPIGSYSPSSGVWTVPELAASAEVSMAITVMAATAGPQTNAIGVEVPSGYTDSNPGNNTASAVVNVNPPVSIICPTNITAFQNSPNGAVVSFNVTATGGSSGAPPVNVSPYASGSVFPFGTTTETASAVDA